MVEWRNRGNVEVAKHCSGDTLSPVERNYTDSLAATVPSYTSHNIQDVKRAEKTLIHSEGVLRRR